MEDFANWFPDIITETNHFVIIELRTAPPVNLNNILYLYEKLWELRLRPVGPIQYSDTSVVCEKIPMVGNKI